MFFTPGLLFHVRKQMFC